LSFFADIKFVRFQSAPTQSLLRQLYVRLATAHNAQDESVVVMTLRGMRSWKKLRRLGALLAVVLLVVACNRAPATPIVPAATPLASLPTAASAAATTAAPVVLLPTVTPNRTPTALPTFVANAPTPDTQDSSPGVASGSVTQGAIFTSPRYSYTVVLPCCWLALPTAGTAIESALAELEAASEMPLWGDLGERIRERDSGAVLELVALLPDTENIATPIAQVTVGVLPTFGLTLDDYLAATAAELNSIGNTEVLTAYIDSTLGVGTFPASVIEYTASPAAAAVDDPLIAGYQVAFFGHDADTLIVLTFTTTVDRFGELQPEFLHIVRTVTLVDTTI
jgi:hypothetical protein